MAAWKIQVIGLPKHLLNISVLTNWMATYQKWQFFFLSHAAIPIWSSKTGCEPNCWISAGQSWSWYSGRPGSKTKSDVKPTQTKFHSEAYQWCTLPHIFFPRCSRKFIKPRFFTGFFELHQTSSHWFLPYVLPRPPSRSQLRARAALHTSQMTWSRWPRAPPSWSSGRRPRRGADC